MKHTKLLLVAFFAMLFSATLSAQTIYGYAIYGDVPYGYTDLRSSVSAVAQGSVTFVDNVLTGAGMPERINETSNYLRMSFSSAQTLSLTDNFALHIVLQKADGATNKVQVSLCNNGWNAARISWEIENANISDENASNVALNYADRRIDNYNTHNASNIVGDNKSISGEILRICAANGEQFEITQIYIDADAEVPDPVAPVAGDTDAPTGLTLAASNIVDKSVTLTASATDENSPISYTFYYKASGDADFTAVAGAVNANSGADAVKMISGLTPETTYSFKVVASDPSSNSSDYSISGITTLAFVERRYYFFRGDPASVTLPSVGVISYDLRRGVKTNVAPQGGMTLTENKYFSHFARSGSWWSFNQSLSASFDMSEISQADWYLVVKFRTDYTSNSFNIRLNNGISYQVSQNNLSISTDGTWNVLTLALADAKNALTYSAFSTNQMLFQFHADNGAGSYLDIAYAYLTNSASSADDLADATNPVISSLSDGDKTTSSVVLTVTASDDSGEDLTYIVKENDAVLTSTPATGTSGAATAITVSELVGQDHTLTVIARDGAGNEASQNIAVSLPAAVTPPSNLVVTTTNTYKSVTFTMSADDANPSLVYAILDGSDHVLVDNIAGTAGVETVYTLHGLTPETAYSFKVRVTNAASLSTTSDAINITTDALSEHRFYLWRGDNSDIPSTGGLTSTLVNCNVTYSNNTFTKDTRIDKYLSQKTTSTWFALDVTPSETVENNIDDDWYLVVRFRTNMNNNVFFGNRLQFNFVSGGNNFNISNGEWITFNDGIWHTVSFRIGDHAGTLPPSYLTSGTLAFQLHIGSQVVAGEYLDIDYIYFTDDVTNVDEGTQFNKRIALKDTESNDAVLTARDGETVDVDLTRSLSSSYYNTLCLPFDLSADQVEDIFGVASIGKLGNARIKDNDELYLGFEFVNHMEAGVPYLIQPEIDVNNPSFIAGVEISTDPKPTVIDGVISFIGIFSPTEISKQSAESHSVLLLGANNTLSWPNKDANMNGMRAYFQATQTVAYVARRASFMVQQSEIYTDMEVVEPEADQDGKVLRNGQIYIIRNGVVYDIMGKRVQ